MSLLNGFSQMGKAVANYAGALGIEQQKQDQEQKMLELSNQLLTTRETAARQAEQSFRSSEAEKAREFQSEQQSSEIASREKIAGMQANAGRYQWLPGTQIDPKTNQPVNGMWKLPTRGDEAPTFVPGSTIQPRGAGGKASVFELKKSAWLNLHPNDEQGALDYASGHRDMPYADKAKWARTEAAKENPGSTDEELSAAAEKLIKTLAPPQAAPQKITDPAQITKAISDARAAVNAGKDPAAVKRRLQEYGITPPADL